MTLRHPCAACEVQKFQGQLSDLYQTMRASTGGLTRAQVVGCSAEGGLCWQVIKVIRYAYLDLCHAQAKDGRLPARPKSFKPGADVFVCSQSFGMPVYPASSPRQRHERASKHRRAKNV